MMVHVRVRIQRRRSLRNGVTLTELLVVIAIMSVLMALLLPAVQSARSSARTTQCRSNLRQLALGIENHVSQFGHYPTNGWGYAWRGDSSRGYDRQQPGGWVFNVLPFVDQTALREMNSDLDLVVARRKRGDASEVKVPLFSCPARQNSGGGLASITVLPLNAEWRPFVGKTDYAANAGDIPVKPTPGPDDPDELDSYLQNDADTVSNGLFFRFSLLKPADVSDGLTSTLLIAEKHVATTSYEGLTDVSHNQSMLTGDSLDTRRSTFDPPMMDSPQQQVHRFGSAHASGCQYALCDGSVRTISYSIDAAIHRNLGNRRDGNTLNLD